MSNKKNNGLYSPSSFKSGYNQKQRYDLVYSPQKSVEYTFSYYDELRRKLNYIFDYLVFPKYGRYTFIYDITDLLIVENPPVLLRRDLKNVHLNENHFLDKISDNKRYIYTEKEQNLKRDMFSVIRESFMHDLKDIDKTIDYFIEYSKIINSTSKERKTTLFSNPTIMHRNNIHDATVERDTIFDFSVDNSIDLLAKMTIDKENNTLSRNISQIQDCLKNDYKLQRIIEDLYIQRLSDLKVDIEKNPKTISMYNSEQGMAKDAKEISIRDTQSMVCKDYKNIDIEDNVGVKREFKDVVIEHEKYNDLKEEYNKIDISHDVPLKSKKVEKPMVQADEEKTFFLKKKIKSAINEEMYKTDSKKVPKPNFRTDEEMSKVDVEKAPKPNLEIEEFKNKEKFLNVVPTKEIPFVKNSDDKAFTFIDKYGEDELDIDDSKEHLNRVNNYGVGADIQDSPFSLDREAKYGVDLVNNSENDLDLGRASARKLDKHRDTVLESLGARNVTKEEQQTQLNKDMFKVVSKKDEDNILKKSVSKELELELDKQLDLHKRFWFVKSLGKIDYKILPNKDFSYPTDINIFVEKPNFIYSFDFDVEYQDITSDKMVIELYDCNYKRVDTLEIPTIKAGSFGKQNISLNIDTYGNKAKFDLKIQHDNLYYIIIRQPKDIDGYPVLYTVTERFLGENRHPIPFGSDLGTKEIAIHINVMVDFINIMMLMWSKFYYQFTGYTGIQAIYGIVNLVHEWLTLETSLEVDNIEEFHRCFRWLRWEAEKLYNMAKNDPNLTGNAWVEELIYQLVEYMEMHHMNEIPEFDPTHLMDEYRNIFNDPSFDIDIVIDKVKGVRKRAIDTNKISRNKK